MALITLKSNPVHTSGSLPDVGTIAPDFTLVKTDLSELKLSSLRGKRVILNIFPSLDTSVCATSVRRFNELVTKVHDTVVLAISKDLPFAHGRFCSTEGLNNVIPLSAFRDTHFGQEYGVALLDSPLAGLFARAVVVINEEGIVSYRQLVNEITEEPDYEQALRSVSTDVQKPFFY